MTKVLVTGAAGFIGYHVARTLLDQGIAVFGVDNMTPYYRVELKQSRIAELAADDRFEFLQLDLADRSNTGEFFKKQQFSQVIHMAAQAGVRYSLENPNAYIDSNLVGFSNLLEAGREQQWQHFVFASSSSVYGANQKVPFSEKDFTDQPINLYAATKKANELMAHAYSHLFKLPMTGLRFFTVYGPWGRPDMAIWKFTEAILAGRPIDVYNRGVMERDFTYIDDIVKGILSILECPPSCGEPASEVPFKVYNIGNNSPEPLEKVIATLEEAVGKKAQRNLLPMQPGDMPQTYADIDSLMADAGFRPSTPIEEGIRKFVAWYLEYNG